MSKKRNQKVKVKRPPAVVRTIPGAPVKPGESSPESTEAYVRAYSRTNHLKLATYRLGGKAVIA